MVSEGGEAPAFTLPGAGDGGVERFSLGDFVGENVVVLCFFPGAFNPHGERDGWLQSLDLLTLQRNVAVLGVGPDTAYTLAEFADQQRIDFPLLADTAGEVAEAYGVRRESFDGHAGIPARAVFVVDDRGTVVHRWVADSPLETPDADEVRAAIGGAQSDESALERYRVAFDYARYGREEFDLAMRAYESDDWHLAREAFAEAAEYLDDAADGFGAAQWFAASDDLAGRLRAAKSHLDHRLQAARWYREAAAHRLDGTDEMAADYEADAERQRNRAEDADALPAPDDLARLSAAEVPA